MKETFRYRGYSAELTWAVAGDRVEATVKVTAAPRVAQEKNCYCSRFGYLSYTGVGDEKLGLTDREAKAKRLAIKTKNRLKQDIDDHLKKHC